MNVARYGFAGFVIVLAAAAIPAVIERVVVESRPSAVEICIDFNAVNTVALRAGVPVTSILASARDNGVSSALLSEEYLGQGAADPKLLRLRYGMAPDNIPHGIFTPDYWNGFLPAGFSEKKIQAIESAGLAVVLRPQNMGDPAWLAADNNIAGKKLLLDTKEIPGYPSQVSLFSRLPDNLLIIIEFSPVAGIESVKQMFPRRIIQGHAIYPQEQAKNMEDAVWVARWARAVRERGARFLLVYPREQDSPDRASAYVRSISESVRRQGFITGPVSAPRYPFGGHTGFRVSAALVCAVMFPLGALAWCNRFAAPAARFAAVNAVTVFGGLVIAALLFDGSFMQRLIGIPFIKAAMLAPVFLSPLVLFRLADIKQWWMQPIQVRHVAIFAAVLFVFFLFMLRAGNTAGEWARPDTGLRQWLESALSVRPRTKEFLFGQPLLFAGFASGNAWLVWLGMIGQVSVINTFLHAHTPVLISLVRVVYGVAIGWAIGWALSIVLRRRSNGADVRKL